MLIVFGIIYIFYGLLLILDNYLLFGFVILDLGLFSIIYDILIKRKERERRNI